MRDSTSVSVRRILVDDAIDLGPQAEGVEIAAASAPLDLGPRAPHEVLLVTTDEDLLAEAGLAGIHRIVADDAAATGDAVRQFVDFLDR
jgi:hypothetical protein